MSEQEDKWSGLMRAANGGDEAAYRQLLALLVPALRAFTRRGLSRTGRSIDEAEDIVQDILLAVHLKRHTWREDAPFAPWLYAIARNKLIDNLRRKGNRQHLPIEDYEDILPEAEDDSAPQSSDLAPLLPQLPEGQRAVVQAIAVDGVSISQAAQRLKLSEGAVRVALHRGVQALAARVRERSS